MQTKAAARRRRRPRVVLEAWFPGGLSLKALARRLAGSLQASGIPATARPRLDSVPHRSWVKTWRATLKPMAIGRRFLVVQEAVPAPARTQRSVIRVPLGQAFGTGEHPTTRLCLRFLEDRLRAGDRVVDLGTGTGLLAIAALRLGAGHVLAVDDDPIAVRVARDTLRRNRLTGAIDLLCCDATEACRGASFDLALANIGESAARRFLPDLARALRPRGRAIITGHLVEDEDSLAALARSSGLRLEARLRARPWSAILLRQPLT